MDENNKQKPDDQLAAGVDSAGGNSSSGSDSDNDATMPKIGAMEHGPKVIQPSAEFEAEMAKENQAPSDQSQPDSAQATDGVNPPQDTEKTTPAAVQDFINSGSLNESEPAPATSVMSEPQPQSSVSPELSSQPQNAGVTPNFSATQRSNNLHPVTGQPLVPSEPPKSGKKKWLMPSVIGAVIIIILALLWLFLLYLPNTPGAVYSASLTRTGEAVDKLIAYGENDNKASNYQSAAVAGSVQVNGKNYTFSSNLNGDYDKNGNTTTNLRVDAKTQGDTNSHIKARLSLLTLKTQGEGYPDVYFKLTGIDSILSALGASGSSPLGSFDGKWILISHDLIKKYLNQYSGQSSSSQNRTKAPTKAQIYDAINKVQAVNKQYIFTDNQTTAVLVKKSYIGAETKYGRSVYHYKMGYDKAHLLAYVGAVGQALDSSSLNDWSQKAYKKDLSQELNINNIKQQIQKKANANYTFDMWADRKTKLIEAVQFDVNRKDNTSVTFAQTYSGGNDYPFIVAASGNSNGDESSGMAKIDLNGANHTATFTFNLNDNNHGNKTTASGNFSIMPSSSHVKVTTPKNAEPLEEVLQQIGINLP